jgi:DNA-binding FrmR family transcriptional regulator
VTQISAASKAIDQAGFKLVASGLAYCLSNPDQAATEGYDIDDVQKMFLKLA